MTRKKTRVSRPKINSQQKKFVDLLVLDPRRSATKAYMTVYQCSEKAAGVNASKLLRNVKVSEYLEKREAVIEKKLRERYNIAEDRILEEISMLAFTRMGDVAFWGPDGMELFPSENLDEFVKAGVVEVSQTTTQYGGSLKIKLADKAKPLEILGKNIGMFKEKVEHGVADNSPLSKLLNNIFGDGQIKPTGVSPG